MLKEREQKILDYMRKEIREKGYPPTVREICSALDIKSTSTAHKDISSLVSKGYIKKDPSKPRALMLVDNGQDPVHDKTSESVQKNIQNSVSQTEVVDIREDRSRYADTRRTEHRRQLSDPCTFRRQRTELHAHRQR